MMIEHTNFARSNTILSDQNASLLGYNIMEEGLVKFLLDQDYRANKFCPIICVVARSYDHLHCGKCCGSLYDTGPSPQYS